MEKFNKRTFGNLSNGIATIKKIFNQPKKVVASEEVEDRKGMIIIEEAIIEEPIVEEIVSEEAVIEEPIVEEIVSEEPTPVSEEKPKKVRKKKSE